MLVKSVSSPIGSFDATFSKYGLKSLAFIGDTPSNYPCDPELQKSIDSFFSKRGLKSLPRMDLQGTDCLLYTSPSPRDRTRSRMPSSA